MRPQVRKRKIKDVEVKARVTRSMRDALDGEADRRGETVSLVVREAVSEYLARRCQTPGKAPGVR